ncbi:uncharacterized protein [Primulina eburnea]|uniref:uncharacterized protein n=1 Tax=Primulina eburnea TaxID=1245227 RepID=UPI003C6C43A2
MYIKLETTRLDYYRRHQSEIRSELCRGVVDIVANGESRGSEVEQRVVLPASFIGGQRDMRRRYLDAIALVQKFGKPDLFITMTCNPDWKEIRENLFEDEIRAFQDARWVSASESVWRIFEFDLNEISHAVINLRLHLLDKHMITFSNYQKLGNVSPKLC